MVIVSTVTGMSRANSYSLEPVDVVLKVEAFLQEDKYLPWEFLNVYITVIHTPHSANAENTKDTHSRHINNLITKLPEFIIYTFFSGRFDASHNIIFHDFYKYMNCLARENFT